MISWRLTVAFHAAAAAAAKSLQSCLTLCDPLDCSPPGSSVPEILQARTLEWVPFPSPMHESEKESEVAQSCLTLSNPMDCSPPGSSAHGVLRAGALEWVPLPSPRHESEKGKWSRSAVSDSWRPPGLQPTRLLRPWGSPGRSTGVGAFHSVCCYC